MSAAKTKDEGEPRQRRAWLGDEVDRLITWMRTHFAEARLDQGAGEAAAVIRILERERGRLAHEANRQALRRTVRRVRSKRFSGEVS